jgi:hypothetical protein
MSHKARPRFQSSESWRWKDPRLLSLSEGMVIGQVEITQTQLIAEVISTQPSLAVLGDENVSAQNPGAPNINKVSRRWPENIGLPWKLSTDS